MIWVLIYRRNKNQFIVTKMFLMQYFYFENKSIKPHNARRKL